MAWGFGQDGFTEVSNDSYTPEFPNAEEPAHRPDSGLFSHSYQPALTVEGLPEETGWLFGRRD